MWLEENHATATELWVGFYKRDSEKPSITWPESVDQALCFGWIDGIRKRVDKITYKIRFTPRRRSSIWSAINIKRAETGTNATSRIKSVRGADREQVRHLFVRTTNDGVGRAICNALKEEQSSLEFFRNAAAVISKNDRLVDY